MSKQEPLPRGLSKELVRERKARAEEIVRNLYAMYPDARCALNYDTPFQLLIATILSAQCTDERVNMVTPILFERFPTAGKLAVADATEVEEIIRSTGFFRQKTKSILGAAQLIVDEFDGVTPNTVEELIKLPGTARKTANVVVSNCFPENASGIAIDTHVQRIVRRLGLVKSFAPLTVEKELMKIVPKEDWNMITHLLIDHGRAVCKAPTPKCFECELAELKLCPSDGRW